MIFSQYHSVVTVLASAADRYNANPATDIVNTKLYSHITFVLSEGAGGTGTVKIQVEECSDASGTGNTAIAFYVRENATIGTPGTLTSVAAAGHTTTAGANKDVLVEVDATSLSEGKPFVRLQLTEVVNDPCQACVVAVCSQARYPQDSLSDPLV